MADITVVIPTFNRAGIVPLAIKSALAQTHAPVEVIVVNDGSSDDTARVLESYPAPVRAIHQENGGLSAARNTGIAAARTEWIAFLDDDDEHEPDRLAIAAEGMSKHPDAVVHATNTALVSRDGTERDVFSLRGQPVQEQLRVERPLPWILRGCFFAQTLVVRKRHLIEAGLFRKTYYEDMDLCVRLARLGPWIMDGRCSLRLIRREGDDENLSSQWRKRPIENFSALTRIHREALQLPNLAITERQLAATGLGTYLFELGCAYQLAGESSRARKCLWEAAKVYPESHSRLKAVAALVWGRAGAAWWQRRRLRPNLRA